MNKLSVELRKKLSIWLGPVNLLLLAVNLLMAIPEWTTARLVVLAVQFVLLAFQVACGISWTRATRRENRAVSELRAEMNGL